MSTFGWRILAFGAIAWLGAPEARAGSALVAHGSVGFVPGQSIQVSVANPAPQGCPTRQPALMTVHLLDANGRDLAVSPVITVAPGQTKTYVVKRTSLPPAGDPVTGRLRVRAETRLEITSQPREEAQVLITTTELINELTGENSGMIGDIRTVISAEANLSTLCVDGGCVCE